MPWCRTGQNQVRYRGDRIMTAAVLATFDSAALPAPVAADGESSVELGVVLAGHQQRLGHRLQFHGGRQAHVLLAGQQRLGLRGGIRVARGEPGQQAVHRRVLGDGWGAPGARRPRQPVHRRVQVLLAGQPPCATPWAPPGTTSGSSSWPKPSPSPWPASAPGRRPPPSTLTPGAGPLSSPPKPAPAGWALPFSSAHRRAAAPPPARPPLTHPGPLDPLGHLQLLKRTADSPTARQAAGLTR